MMATDRTRHGTQPPRLPAPSRGGQRTRFVRPSLEDLEEREVLTNFPTIGVFDPSTGTWYLRNEDSPGIPDAGVFKYGLPGWVPVVGDWTDQGQTTVGVVDPASVTWYLRNENSAGAPDAAVFRYGAPGWL